VSSKNTILDQSVSQSINYLKTSINQGNDWVSSLLASMALWTLPEENYKNRYYRYILGGEAFDWLVLAERLIAEVSDLIPEEEKIRLLFNGDLGENVSQEGFKDLLGPNKYSAYLNYWYGIVVEEALLHCVEQEEIKKSISVGFKSTSKASHRAFLRLYGFDHGDLLKKFKQDKMYPNKKQITLTESKEFTYWLFKYRVAHSDGSRVASDTRKAMVYMEKQGYQMLP
jgi:hypothetical protein